MIEGFVSIFVFVAIMVVPVLIFMGSILAGDAIAKFLKGK